VDLLRSRQDLERLRDLRAQGPLVFVPTMGALHEGHFNLVRSAGELGPVVVSIFVNPTQFGPGEDLDRYPRDLDRDLKALAPLAPAAVFAPSVNEMYRSPDGVSVSPGNRAKGLCGARRPGHFAGVLTVVAKLFNLVRPDLAVFGRKDGQQCLVIDEMVRDLDFSIRLVDAPTAREDDGLAMSSRNRYLNEGDRQRAVSLWRSLNAVKASLIEGERDVSSLEALLTRELAETDGIDYAEIRTVPDLARIDRAAGKVIVAVAAQVGPARLIDNMVLSVDERGASETSLFSSRG